MTDNTNYQLQSDYNDDVELRGLIFTLIKGKWIILGVILTCMIISLILSFFIMKPIYESTALVSPASITNLSTSNGYSMIVTNPEGKSILDSSQMSSNMDQIIKLTQLDTNGFKAILTSYTTLDNTIKKLGLKVANIETFKNKITVEQAKEEKDIIQIKVQDSDPQLAALIVNTLIEETVSKMNEINSEKINGLSQNLNEQLEAAQKDLATAFNDLKQYRTRNVADSAIGSEIEQRRLENEVNRRQNIVDSLGTKILEVRVAKSLAATEDKIITLSSAIPPKDPVSPKKMLNLLLASALGLIISIFIVFLRDYIIKKPTNNSK